MSAGAAGVFLSQLGARAIGSMLSGGGVGAGIGAASAAKNAAGGISKEIFGYNFVDLITKLVIYFGIAFTISKFFEALIWGSGFFAPILRLVKGLDPNTYLKLSWQDTLAGIKQILSFLPGTGALGAAVLNVVPANPAKPEEYLPMPKVVADIFTKGIVLEPAHTGPQGAFIAEKVLPVKFWDFVKGLAVALVAWEMWNYYNSNKQAGAEPSPLTLGIFSLIIGTLTVTTVPELVTKLKEYATPFGGGGGVSTGGGAGA